MATTTVINPRSSTRSYLSVDISTAASGASASVDLTGLALSAVLMSTAWTDAKLGLAALIGDSTTYQPVYSTTGDPLTFSTSASRVLVMDPWLTAGLQAIQLVSETSAGVAVAQGATRTLKLSLIKLD